MIQNWFSRLSSPLHLREGLRVGLFLFALAAMTSCSSDDSPAPNPMAEKIAGTWLAEYEAEGTLTIKGEATSYSRVIDVYVFDDVTKVNTWNRYFFRGESPDPFADLGGGSGAQGKFDFTSTDDGTISVTLTDTYLLKPEELPLYAPLNRTLNYADNAIAAAGIDGRTITLLRADEEDRQQLNNWNLRLHGGYDNNGNAINTDVADNSAQEAGRARRR